MAVATPPPGELHFVYNPINVLRSITARPDWIPTHPANIVTAAQIIQSSYPYRDALGTIIDVAGNRLLVTDSTETLAAMFLTGHPSIPAHWKKNLEITRTILSMSAEIELGILRAENISQRYEDSAVLIKSQPNQIKNLEDLLGQLQEMGANQGESGNMMRR